MNRVAIVGASGSIGSEVLKALRSASKDVTVFSRSSSSAVFPEGVRVLRGDYDDQTFIQDGLTGIDALVLCVGTLIPSTQIPFIDAAISAGVKYIIPSEFGTDSGNPEYAAHVPIIPPKIAIQKYLNQQLTKPESQFMWTGIVNGLILDWSIPRGVLGIDVSNKEATLLDQGATKADMTTLPTIAHAVVNLLQLSSRQRERFANKLVYISSFCIFQLDLLESVQRVTSTPKSAWKVQFQTTDDKVAVGKKRHQHGDQFGLADLIYGHVFKDGAGGNYRDRVGINNEDLSLPQEELDEELRRIIAIS